MKSCSGGCWKNKQKRTARRRLIQEKGQCNYCGAKEKLTVDHIIPYSKGGTNAQTNWQVLCLKCNMEKGNKINSLIR